MKERNTTVEDIKNTFPKPLPGDKKLPYNNARLPSKNISWKREQTI
jgi:hypothetical protein